MAGKTIVNSPEAGAFIDTMSLNAGRNAALGDKMQFDDVPNAYNAIGKAHEAMTYVLPKIAALVDDVTRTPPQLHEVGREFARRTVETLSATNATLVAEAAKAEADAREMIDTNFAADPSRVGIESEIREYIRDMAKTEGGISKLHQEAESNREMASVLYHSPIFLLRLGQATRDNIVMDAIIVHLPDAAKLMMRNVALTKVANGYAQVIRSVHASFYNRAIADLMRLRVEA